MATTKTTKRGPGRPPKNPRAKKVETPTADDLDDLSGATEKPSDEDLSLDMGTVYGGVSAHWLSHVFGMDRVTVKKRLAEGKCKIVGKGRTGAPMYLVRDAAAWLVKPQVDITSYIKSLRPNDLPPILNAAYWDAMLKRQKWEENAGDLWRTNDVMDVFGSLAATLKSTIQLWPEQVSGRTDKQRLELEQRCDGLLNAIHHILVESPNARRTPSSMEEPPEKEDDLV